MKEEKLSHLGILLHNILFLQCFDYYIKSLQYDNFLQIVKIYSWMEKQEISVVVFGKIPTLS